MVDCVVFAIGTKIVDSSAPNPKLYGNIDKAVICQILLIMYVRSCFILALCRCHSWNI